MTRFLMAVCSVIALAVEGPPMGDLDLTRYALTQGGLLVVVLVLLWSYRKDLQTINKQREDQVKILTDLVGTNTTAMVKASAASEATEKAVARLSNALDRYERG